MEPLGRSDQRRLLAIARGAIESVVCRTTTVESVPEAPSAGMSVAAAAFVTIHKRGQLRGCIGLMRFETPIWRNVRDAAIAAAVDDPRFAPVEESEVPALELEVTILAPPVALADPSGFVAGLHGIVVERGLRRALLLPQVAVEMGWDERQMLEAVCRKADLPADAWRDRSTRLFVFDSTCFGEAGLVGESGARPIHG